MFPDISKLISSSASGTKNYGHFCMKCCMNCHRKWLEFFRKQILWRVANSDMTLHGIDCEPHKYIPLIITFHSCLGPPARRGNMMQKKFQQKMTIVLTDYNKNILLLKIFLKHTTMQTYYQGLIFISYIVNTSLAITTIKVSFPSLQYNLLKARNIGTMLCGLLHPSYAMHI